MNRLRLQAIDTDLRKKLVFLSGPRQVGKTFLAKQLMAENPGSVYLNYDHITSRSVIKNQSWLPGTPLLVFDEIHKMPGWKNYIKGVFDTRPEGQKILVTGSARLETFRKSGDSMAGRFFSHHLMPVSFAELAALRENNEIVPFAENQERSRLTQHSGFPEPLLSEKPDDVLRWRTQYIDGLIRNDVLDFERIYDFRALHTVFELLRTKVGTPVSYRSLSVDAQISPVTARKYVDIMEALFIVFKVSPWSKNIARSLLKEPKVYFYDTALVENGEGALLENLSALSLHSWCEEQRDLKGSDTALHYLRTKDGIECDFCITRSEKIEEILEVKTADSEPAKALLKFAKMTGAKARQLVWNLQQEHIEKNIEILSAEKYLRALSKKVL